MSVATDRFGQLTEDPRFSSLVSRLDNHLKGPLAAYLARSTPVETEGSPNAKAFKDGVWGMIDLTAREVAIVDSPPFQRLRRVRQLGLGYLTYPTAGYTRFEHSLGAVHQCERMVRAITARSSHDVRDVVLNKRHVVRLAALAHDLGHMPASHVTERYFTGIECGDASILAEAEDIRLAAQGVLLAPDPKLAECLSVAIMRTESFHQLLTSHAGYSEDDVAIAALAIVGSPAQPDMAFVPQLITNIVDADKLDYMFRDAWATRVPLAVDLERMLYKLKCLSIPPNDLPGSLKRYTGGRNENVLVLASDQSGNRLVYDLTVGRTMLFERVYLHHKTRAAERVALAALRAINGHFADLVVEGDEILGTLGVRLYPKASSAIQMLINRDLPRRSFAMSYAFLAQGDDEPGDKEQILFEDIARELRSLDRRELLQQAVLRRAVALARIYPGKAEAPTGVWLDTEPLTPAIGKNDFLVEHPDGRVDSEGTNFAPEGSAATHAPEDVVYFFSSGSRTSDVLVHIAAELEIARSFGLSFGPASADRAKIDRREVDRIKRGLERNKPDLFDRFGAHRPECEYARKGPGWDNVVELASRWQQFNAGGAKIDPDHILSFLDQFPEALVGPLLDALDRLVFLSREELVTTLGNAIAPLVSAGAVLVPLTRSPVDSASHVGYYVAKAQTAKPIQLDVALESDNDIVMFDDCLVSGYQSSGVIHTLMRGKKTTERAIPLDKEQRERLRSRHLHFVFAYTADAGQRRLQAKLNEARIQATIHPAGTFLPDKALDGIGHSAGALREFLRRVGVGVLVSSKSGSKSACRERALGWGNDEHLVVSTFGVPKGTITALWHHGQFRNTQWQPLFPVQQQT